MVVILEYVLNLLGKFIVYLISNFGYSGVFFSMVLESACIPLPSEIILPFAGYLVYLKKFALLKISLIASLGNVVGGLLAYLLGKYAGRPFIRKYGKYILLTELKLKKTEEFFYKYGEITVFIGRMLPVVRTFISLPAGIAKMNPLKMSIYTFLGSLPWCVFLIYTGQKLGENWETIRAAFHHFHIILVIVAIVLLSIYFIYFIIIKNT